MKDIFDSRLFVFLSLVGVLVAYVVLSLNGSDVASIPNLLYILVGALAGVTVPKP